MLRDPSGAFIGAWQPQTFHGFGAVYEANAPTWFELHTRDYAKAVDFYRGVFGWTTEVASDTDELRYTLLKHGDTQLAGIMDDTGHGPDTVGSHWTIYFGVTDADATAARVRELGGSVVMDPMDTPYGRLASVTDPTGAAFNLMQPTAETPMEARSDHAATSATR